MQLDVRRMRRFFLTLSDTLDWLGVMQFFLRLRNSLQRCRLAALTFMADQMIWLGINAEQLEFRVFDFSQVHLDRTQTHSMPHVLVDELENLTRVIPMPRCPKYAYLLWLLRLKLLGNLA